MASHECLARISLAEGRASPLPSLFLGAVSKAGVFVILSGDEDTRVPPEQARKMVALLQASSSSAFQSSSSEASSTAFD